MVEKEILDKLNMIELDLSKILNLASMAEQRRRYRALQAERRDLITALGREPSLEELYPRMSPIGANFPSNKD